MNVNLKSIIRQLESSDQSDIYDAYEQLINFVKFNIVETQSIIDIFEFLVPHLIDQQNSDELHSKVLEVSNFMIDFFTEEHLPLINVLLDSLSQYGFIGNENGDIREKIESLISTILKTNGATDMVVELFEHWIDDESWRTRLHIINLMMMAVTSSLLDSTKLIESHRSLIEKLLLVFINDFDDEDVYQLVAYIQKEATGGVFEKLLESFVKDMKIKSQLYNKLNIAPPQQSTTTISTLTNKKPTLISSKLSNSTTASSITKHTAPTPAPTTGRAIGSRPSKVDPFGLMLLNQGLDEHQLEIHLNEIISKLSDSKCEWNIKVNNLIKLQALMKNGAADFPLFNTMFHKLKEPLLVQVTDVRSQLIKEACATISVVVEFMKNQFEQYIDHYLEVLLKNVIVTIQIISQSCDNCIKSIITSSKSIKVLPRITDMLKHKSPVMRSRCSEYINILLQTIAPSTLERHGDTLEKVIRAGVSDADPTARKFSRQSFLVYSEHFPHRSESLLQSFDQTVKKLISKEMQINIGDSENESDSQLNIENNQTTTTTIAKPIKAQPNRIQTRPTPTISSAVQKSTTSYKPPISSTLNKPKPTTTTTTSTFTTGRTVNSTLATNNNINKPQSTLLQKRVNHDDYDQRSNFKHIKLDPTHTTTTTTTTRPTSTLSSTKFHSINKKPVVPLSTTSQQFVSFFNNNNSNRIGNEQATTSISFHPNNSINQPTSQLTISQLMKMPPTSSILSTSQNRPITTKNYFQDTAKKATTNTRTLMPLSSSNLRELKISDLGDL